MNYENDYELIYLIREKDDYAFTYILNKYSKIINIICNKYYSKYKYIGLSYEDLVQEARFAVSKLINNYDEEKTLFYSFLIVCVERHLLSFCKKYNNMKNYPLNYSLSDDVFNYVKEDNCSYEVDSILTENELFFECKNCLSFNQSIVFELRYNNFTYKEISILLGLPLSTIDGRLCLIRKKLKSILNINI